MSHRFVVTLFSIQLCFAALSIAASPAYAVSSRSSGPAVPGLGAIQETADEGVSVFAGVAISLMSVGFIVAMLQIARGNGNGWYVLMSVVAAIVLTLNRVPIVNWIQSKVSGS